MKKEDREILGVAIIENDLYDSLETEGALGSYQYLLGKFKSPFSKVLNYKTARWKQGRISDFDRVKRGPWDLLYLVLRDAVGYRNGGKK